jgi:hypothetical protein
MVPSDVDSVRVDIGPDLARKVSLAGQGQRLRREGWVRAPVLRQKGRGRAIAACVIRLSARTQRRHRPQHQSRGIGLRRLPAIERVDIVSQQRQQLGLARGRY